MRYVLGVSLLALLSCGAQADDRDLDAKAALLLAPSTKKVETCPACAGPSSCLCDPLNCQCANCIVTKTVTVYTWKESADPCCSLLYADGKAIGWYNSMKDVYYTEVQPGYGKAAVCPTCTPARKMSQYPVYYQPQYRMNPVFFLGVGAAGCPTGG